MFRRHLWIVAMAFVCPALSEGQAIAAPKSGGESSEFAWRLFIYVNQSFGQGRVLWQDWATINDVFGDPKRKPHWSERSHEPFTHEPILQLALLPASLQKPPESAGALPACSIDATEQDVRLNRDTVSFIADHELWYLEGQKAAFKKGKRLSFGPGSIEIKAMWKPIKKAEKDLYFSIKSGDSYWGLDGLHITSKLLKNWIWVTFEHEKSGCRCHFVECHDNFGALPAGGRDTQPTKQLRKLFEHAGMGEQWKKTWQHYKLVGIQTTFTHQDGTATILGNSLAEAPLGNLSSCITCHSRATIGGDGMRLALEDKNCAGFVGKPSEKWFTEGGKLRFLQMDFVWSLINAKSSSGMTALPPGCETKTPK